MPLQHWKRFLMGIDIDLVSFDEAIQSIIIDNKDTERSSTTIAFINVHNANIAFDNQEYRSALNNYDHIFPDGIGLRISAYIHGVRLVSSISGTDLVPMLLRREEFWGARVFLLGDRSRNIHEVAINFSQLFPSSSLAGFHHGYFSDDETPRILDLINQSQADILLVGMGTPTQEIWLYKNTHLIDVKIQITVGGLFQYWDGRLHRAPLIAQKMGLEWACILIQQPYRWRRYLIGIPCFLWRSIINTI